MTDWHGGGVPAGLLDGLRYDVGSLGSSLLRLESAYSALRTGYSERLIDIMVSCMVSRMIS